MGNPAIRTSRLPSGLAEDLAACLLPAASASTLPAVCYTDREVHRVERDTVFRRGWIGVGRFDRWSDVGDFSAIDLGGVPVVVVRDTDRLRAFANTCSHRSSQVMVGDGNCSRMRCPFHFWTYALDGRLLGAPSMQRTDGFDRGEHGLHEFALVERYGFVFVSLEGSAPPIDEWLGDFGEVHEASNLAGLVTTHRREFTVECNWKGFAEVFNEYYHLPYVQPGSIDSTYDDPDEPDVVAGAFATHFGTTQGTGGLLEDEQHRALPVMPDLSDREAHGVRYSWIFPNMVIATGAEGMWMYEVYPDGPDRCRCAQVVCFPPETVAMAGFYEVAESYYERFDVAINEDIPVLEQQHLGMRSPFAGQGRFSYLEPSVARFATWYAERLLSAG